MKKISMLRLPIGIFKIDSENKMIYVNKYFCRISGYPKEKLLGTAWLNTIHPDDIATFLPALSNGMNTSTLIQFEFRFIQEGKDDVWVLCNAVNEDRKESSSNYIGTITNITELKKSQDILKNTAYFDPLTQLPSRYLFEEMLTKALNRAEKNKTKLALFYVDIDYFKKVNDAFGRTVGDIFLKEVSERLKKNVRSEDYIVRLGGDEFVIILEDIHDIGMISLSADRIIKNFKVPFSINNHEILSSLSMGISVYPDEETTAETILQHADQALYQAKESGRDCYKYYNKGMQQKLERYMLIAKHLQSAIQNNEFELYYQPQICAKTNLMIGMESLLRWNNPIVKNPSPAEFILIAEETGIISELGDWIISAALQQYKKWYDQFEKMKNVKIAINISAIQLNDSRIIDSVTEALKKNEVPTHNVIFELTETTVMKKTLDNKSLLLTLFMELGIGISIDDFGTGYSSLTYLKQLPIKELKIDKSFVDDIGKNSNDETIIIAIINLAKTLDLEVVAEGVETEKQLNFLKEHQCSIIQGYYFSQPLSVSDMTAYITSMP